MTDQQEYDIFMTKLGSKAQEIREDYLNLSGINQRRIDQTFQAFLETNGIVVTSETVDKLLLSKYLR